MTSSGADQSSPGDASSDPSASRGAARDRALRRFAVASIGSQVVSTLIAIVSVPLLVRHLGREAYGFYATLATLPGVLQFADLGLGSGLTTRIAAIRGSRPEADRAEIITAGALMIGVIAAALALLLVLTLHLVDWVSILGAPSSVSESDARWSVGILGAIVLTALPLGAAQYIRAGLQQGDRSSVALSLGAVVSFFALLLAIRSSAELPVVVGAGLSGGLVGAAINTAVFAVQAPQLRPRRRLVRAGVTKSLARSGRAFFILQLTIAVGISSDALVVAHVLGAGAAAEYAVPARAFALVAAALSWIAAPLWGAFGEALAVGDVGWIRARLRRALLQVMTIGAGAGAAVIAFGQPVLGAWTGNDIPIRSSVLVPFAIWTTLAGAGAVVAMLLNAGHVLRFQVKIASAMAALNLTLSILLVNVVGVSGVLWGSVASYAAVVVIPYAIFVPRYLASLGDRSEMIG